MAPPPPQNWAVNEQKQTLTLYFVSAPPGPPWAWVRESQQHWDCCRCSEHHLESCWGPGHGIGLVAGQIHSKQNDGKVVLDGGKGCVSLLHSQELPGIFATCPKTKLFLCVAVAVKAVLLVQMQREGGCRHLKGVDKRGGCSSHWFTLYFWIKKFNTTQSNGFNCLGIFLRWTLPLIGLLTILFTLFLNCFRAWHQRTEKVTVQ